MLKRNPLATFFVLAYALTWLAWMPLALRGPVYGDRLSYLHFVGSLGPLMSAFVMTGLLSGRSGVRELLGRVLRWRVPLGWHLLAWFGPAALYATAAVVMRVVSGQWPPFSLFGHSDEFAQLAMPIYWVLSIFCYGFGEEAGWRGFALPRLQEKYGGFTSAVIMSVFWALWHLPVFAFSAGMSRMGPGEIVDAECGHDVAGAGEPADRHGSAAHRVGRDLHPGRLLRSEKSQKALSRRGTS